MSEAMTVRTERYKLSEMLLQDRIRFGFSIVLLLLFVYTAYEASSFIRLARYLPFNASIVAGSMMAFSIVTDISTFRRTGRVAVGDVSDTSSVAIAAEEEIAASEGSDGAGSAYRGPRTQREAMMRSLAVLGWIVGYLVGIATIGLMVATPLYLILYLRREANASWRLTIIGTFAILLLLTVMREAVNLQWPPYLLRDMVDSAFAPLYRLGNTFIRTILPFLP
jgi:hypothetical protein